MSHFVNASEIAEILGELDLNAELAALESVLQSAGEAIGKKLNVQVGQADTQPGFGGLCVPFYPSEVGQPIPELLGNYDTSSDWAEGEDSAYDHLLPA
jgi:hypothetical protein